MSHAKCPSDVHAIEKGLEQRYSLESAGNLCKPEIFQRVVRLFRHFEVEDIQIFGGAVRDWLAHGSSALSTDIDIGISHSDYLKIRDSIVRHTIRGATVADLERMFCPLDNPISGEFDHDGTKFLDIVSGYPTPCCAALLGQLGICQVSLCAKSGTVWCSPQFLVDLHRKSMTAFPRIRGWIDPQQHASKLLARPHYKDWLLVSSDETRPKSVIPIALDDSETALQHYS